MSAWETVPDVDDPDIAVMTDAELETYLREIFDEIGGEQRESRFHDQDGFLADDAGSEKCLALGHRPAESDPSEWLPEASHELAFDGETVLCVETKHGTCCTSCEGECSYEQPPLLWNLPGVIGATRA